MSEIQVLIDNGFCENELEAFQNILDIFYVFSAFVSNIRFSWGPLENLCRIEDREQNSSTIGHWLLGKWIRRFPKIFDNFSSSISKLVSQKRNSRTIGIGFWENEAFRNLLEIFHVFFRTFRSSILAIGKPRPNNRLSVKFKHYWTLTLRRWIRRFPKSFDDFLYFFKICGSKIRYS